MVNIQDFSTIDIAKDTAKSIKTQKTIKQKVDIDFLYKKVLEHQKLLEELENYEIENCPKAINTQSISAIDIVKGTTESIKTQKIIKQEIDADCLSKKILEYQKLSEELKGYEIKGYPEVDPDNLEIINELLNIAEECDDCIEHLFEDLDSKHDTCSALEEERADRAREDNNNEEAYHMRAKGTF